LIGVEKRKEEGDTSRNIAVLRSVMRGSENRHTIARLIPYAHTKKKPRQTRLRKREAKKGRGFEKLSVLGRGYILSWRGYQHDPFENLKKIFGGN